MKLLAPLAFLATILGANFVTTEYGLIPVGFGLVATAGTYFAGLAFVLRDATQDSIGKRWTLGAILAGAALSFLVSAPFIAAASAVAFLLSELADFAVYQPLRRRGYVRAALASNAVGALVDTIAFLTIAGFPLRQAVAGQLVGKIAVTLVVLAGVGAYRARRWAVA